MKHKLKKLPEFYAFYHRFGDAELRAINVIDERLIKEIDKSVFKKYYDFKNSKYDILDTREKFIEKLKHEFMYRYWGKCEWEFICSNWTGKDFTQKVDVYEQIKPNIPVIADLIINAMQIEFNKPKKVIK